VDKGINKKLLAIIAVPSAIVILVLIIIFSFSSGGKRVVLVALPNDSIITIDGKHTKAGNVKISEGNHVFKASRQYFRDYQIEVNYKDLESGETLYLLPEPNSPQAFQLLKNNPELQQQREAAGGEESIRIQKILSTNYPIIDELPYENLHYKIGYKLEDTSNVIFTVTLYGIINSPSQYGEYQNQLKQFKTEALDHLKSSGIDINKEKIEFTPNID
jgi:hypothetical protein